MTEQKLSPDAFKEILYGSTKDRVKQVLKPVFQAIGEMTKGTSDEMEMRLELLNMVQRATTELVEEHRERIRRASRSAKKSE